MPGTMDQHEVLTSKNVPQKIEDAIARWAPSTKNPLYNMEQLAVMALITAAGSLTKEDIANWICDHFGFYRQAVVRAYCDTSNDLSNRTFPPKQTLPKSRSLEDVLDVYDIPFEQIYTRCGSGLKVSYGINFYHGLPLIEHIINKKTEVPLENVDFFSLPAEIRTTIYEMVFGYPKRSGLIVENPAVKVSGSSPIRLWIATDEHTHPFGLCEQDLEQEFNPILMQHVRPYERIMDPLLTCRQFYNEAMPTFYRINHFHTNSLRALHSFLGFMPRNRRRHLRHITTTYWSKEDQIATKTFRLLLDAKNLSVLNLRIDEQNWLQSKNLKIQVDNSFPSIEVENASRMPGIATLRCLHDLDEVNLEGASEESVRVIRDSLMKLK